MQNCVESSDRDALSLYSGTEYLELTAGAWHLEDSPFKARYIDKLARRHDLQPRTVCELGCGAGGVLAELQKTWADDIHYTGYEISPTAHTLSQQFTRPNLCFRQGDCFATRNVYDLVLVLDVIEHVEDCFAFLRHARKKGRHKIYHIPLEINCSTAMRDILAKGFSVGHIHHFSASTALAALRFTGHRVIDWLYTPVGLECGKFRRTAVMNVVRRTLPAPLAARLVGGYSLLVLAE
jgi:2-polyprenyl-3-methyl-5-hydroxy-6-metoxy-1,4-benzoquinol methylase